MTLKYENVPECGGGVQVNAMLPEDIRGCRSTRAGALRCPL